MPLLDLQRRMRELGRIRTGVQVATSSGKRRPSKLETFRLTSGSRELLDEAAAIYGGQVRPWTSPAGQEWELVTEADVLDIVVPPGQGMSQWWELWSGGGCERRCDGQTNVITDEPCECPGDLSERRELAADGRACKPTTRLSVILPAIPDIGVWRLESHGYYAAVELAGTAEFLERATASGRLIPARLRLDQREVKRPGKPTMRFAVPIIELPQTRMSEFMPTIDPGPVAQLTAGTPPERQRRGRFERPVMADTAPDPSAEAAFTKPAPGFGTAPETVAGWEVADEEPEAETVVEDTPVDTSMDAIVADALDAAPPMTRGEFLRAATSAHRPKADVLAAHKALGISLENVTDADYGRLANHLGISS